MSLSCMEVGSGCSSILYIHTYMHAYVTADLLSLCPDVMAGGTGHLGHLYAGVAAAHLADSCSSAACLLCNACSCDVCCASVAAISAACCSSACSCASARARKSSACCLHMSTATYFNTSCKRVNYIIIVAGGDIPRLIHCNLSSAHIESVSSSVNSGGTDMKPTNEPGLSLNRVCRLNSSL